MVLGAGPMDRFHAGIYSCYTSRLDLGRLGWSGFLFHEAMMMARDGWRGAGPLDRYHANIYSCYTSRLARSARSIGVSVS